MMDALLFAEMKKMSTAELFAALYTDPLTSVGNRRAMDRYRDKFPTVAIVDLDSLKWINDNLGHVAGDAQLTGLVDVLRREFTLDRIFRTGGDEFIVFGFGQLALGVALSRCRERFAGMSYGIGDTIAEADEALNAAKRHREAVGLRASRGECPPWVQNAAA